MSLRPPPQPAVGARRRSLQIASFPPVIPQNPYQRLLYEHLDARGVELVPGALLFKVRRLLRARRRVDVLHFHWPQAYYRHDRGTERLRPVLSWLRLELFVVRLIAARLLGFTIAWTVHQVYPHDRAGLLDLAAGRALARAADVLFVHDRWTLDTVRRELGASAATKCVLATHGSYVGVYPQGRDRAAARRELGIADSSFVFLCFGNLRAYKDLETLLAAFATVRRDDVALVIAGSVMDEALASRIAAAAREDRRIVPLLSFLPDDRVAELFASADAVVLPRSDGGTSGAVILALSLGKPVVVADRPTYRELVGDGAAGWFFGPGSAVELASALELAASDRESAKSRAAAAAERALDLRWEDAAAATAGALVAARRHGTVIGVATASGNG